MGLAHSNPVDRFVRFQLKKWISNEVLPKLLADAWLAFDLLSQIFLSLWALAFYCPIYRLWTSHGVHSCDLTTQCIGVTHLYAVAKHRSLSNVHTTWPARASRIANACPHYYRYSTTPPEDRSKSSGSAIHCSDWQNTPPMACKDGRLKRVGSWSNQSCPEITTRQWKSTLSARPPERNNYNFGNVCPLAH